MSETDAGVAKASMFPRCLLLIAVVVGLWLFAAWPAFRLAGQDGLIGLTVAALLCLLPGLVVFVMASAVPAGSPKAVSLIVAGSGLRMAVVLLGVLGVRAAWPEFGFRQFLIWVLLYYLATLGLETAVLLRRPQANRPRANH